MKRRFFNTARIQAFKSDYNFRHGAVLVRGGKIINCSCNKKRPVSFAHRYHHNQCGSLHAEIGCVLNMNRIKTEDCDLYVVRIFHDGRFAMSRPCSMCQIICHEMGIRRIYYSIGPEEFGMIRLG